MKLFMDIYFFFGINLFGYDIFMIKISVIPGDGIGKEVMAAGVDVLDKLDLNLDYVYGDAGFELYEEIGDNLPDETVKQSMKCDATLFGAVTSVPGEKSAIIELRKALNVYGNLRPVKSYEGVRGLHDDVDFLIVRENTEGLYSQVEWDCSDGFVSNRIISRGACERICRLAFDQCLRDGRETVTLVHKANVLRKSDGLFKDVFYSVSEEYSGISVNDFYVDACAMYLVTNPWMFDVVVTSNLFGDILSDEGAGIVGGLGVAPSGNVGDDNGLFEPVHGSAPDIAGLNISNPVSMILSVGMLLDYLDEGYYAGKVRDAVGMVLKEGKVRTPDLGGVSKTLDLSNEVINKLEDIL